jgi:hypothetical protein
VGGLEPLPPWIQRSSSKALYILAWMKKGEETRRGMIGKLKERREEEEKPPTEIQSYSFHPKLLVTADFFIITSGHLCYSKKLCLHLLFYLRLTSSSKIF